MTTLILCLQERENGGPLRVGGVGRQWRGRWAWRKQFWDGCATRGARAQAAVEKVALREEEGRVCTPVRQYETPLSFKRKVSTLVTHSLGIVFMKRHESLHRKNKKI